MEAINGGCNGGKWSLMEATREAITAAPEKEQHPAFAAYFPVKVIK